MKKILFIDRDGTLIREPEDNQQVDSLLKLAFLPKVISALRDITLNLDYELVMVTNQDGLGSPSFPEANFWPAHQMMLEILSGEGVDFKAVHIDRSFESDKLPTRKPGIAMLEEYLSGGYNLAQSYVIGDRESDVELAKNLGSRSIRFGRQQGPLANYASNDWEEIYHYLRRQQRYARQSRKTAETDIQIELALLGSGKSEIETGLGFFDHMLAQFSKHSGADLKLVVKGDLHVDEHHTIEDTAIVLGRAVNAALNDKRGLVRYGYVLPMDDALAQVAIDLSGRSWLTWQVDFKREMIGDMPTEMFSHFFKSFCDSAGCTLNIKAEGSNEHHKIESIFKAFAKALSQAWKINLKDSTIPSTKEAL